MNSSHVAFHCADALTAPLGAAAMVWLDNQAFEPEFMRAVYTKLIAELPEGAIVVDFAALDAQFDYPRAWNAVEANGEADEVPFGAADERTVSATSAPGSGGTLQLIGCATLDTSWDRGAGTHVALLSLLPSKVNAMSPLSAESIASTSESMTASRRALLD